VWTVRTVVWAQIVLLIGTYLADIPVERSNVLMIFLWAVVTASVAVGIESRLWPAVVVSSSAFLVACWRLEWTFYCMAASNFGLLVNMVAVWSRLKDDFVDPIQKRAEERHQRWAAFLEKSRLPIQSDPPPPDDGR
jgi:K+-sensing histidine kinase KdpD